MHTHDIVHVEQVTYDCIGSRVVNIPVSHSGVKFVELQVSLEHLLGLARLKNCSKSAYYQK